MGKLGRGNVAQVAVGIVQGRQIEERHGCAGVSKPSVHQLQLILEHDDAIPDVDEGKPTLNNQSTDIGCLLVYRLDPITF